jgi:hypothetical protein
MKSVLTFMTRIAARNVTQNFQAGDRHSGSSGCSGTAEKASRKSGELGTEDRVKPGGTEGPKSSASFVLRGSVRGGSAAEGAFPRSPAVTGAPSMVVAKEESRRRPSPVRLGVLAAI